MELNRKAVTNDVKEDTTSDDESTSTDDYDRNGFHVFPGDENRAGELLAVKRGIHRQLDAKNPRTGILDPMPMNNLLNCLHGDQIGTKD